VGSPSLKGPPHIHTCPCTCTIFGDREPSSAGAVVPSASSTPLSLMTSESLTRMMRSENWLKPSFLCRLRPRHILQLWRTATLSGSTCEPFIFLRRKTLQRLGRSVDRGVLVFDCCGHGVMSLGVGILCFLCSFSAVTQANVVRSWVFEILYIIRSATGTIILHVDAYHRGGFFKFAVTKSFSTHANTISKQKSIDAFPTMRVKGQISITNT